MLRAMPSLLWSLSPLLSRVRRGRSRSVLRRDLRASLGDGASFSLMVGLGETYLPAFVLALGMGDIVAGLIATVPMLAGALLQMASPAAVARLGSHRSWVILCAAVQASSFVPLLLAALAGWIPVPGVFLIAAVYWGTGMATGPAWNTWMGRIVPGPLRARYFAKRSRVAQTCVLAGFLAGGFLLEAGASSGRLLGAFAALFAAAALCRYLSALFLALQSEPPLNGNNGRTVSARELLRRFREGGEARLFLYLLSVQASVHIASAYFNPYMLRQLALNYSAYTILIAAAFVAKILMLPVFGALAHRFGAGRLLWFGGIAIVPLSALWLISDSFLYLLAVQFIGGVAWAAFELAAMLIFFETIPEEERTSLLTTYNLVNAVATVGGAMLGGALLRALGGGYGAYMAIFAISSGARLLTLLFIRWIPPVKLRGVPLATRTVAVRPSAGTVERPVLPSLPREALESPGTERA